MEWPLMVCEAEWPLKPSSPRLRIRGRCAEPLAECRGSEERACPPPRHQGPRTSMRRSPWLKNEKASRRRTGAAGIQSWSACCIPGASFHSLNGAFISVSGTFNKSSSRPVRKVWFPPSCRTEKFNIGHALAILRAGAFDDAVVVVPLRLDKRRFRNPCRIGFGLEDFGQAGEVVGVAVGDEDALNCPGIRRRGPAKPAREVAGKHWLSPPSTRITLPSGDSMTLPSPCWTSTKFTLRTSF